MIDDSWKTRLKNAREFTKKFLRFNGVLLLEPSGVLFEAIPTKLRGMVDVDPERDDFFRVIVEERLRLSSRAELSDIETKRLEKALKDPRKRNLLWHLRADGSPR
jgi:hypothetical protein